MTTIGLDFLGIGAQKAGTTSLHHYMRTHPELYLPEAKEQPFFTVDTAFEEGWDSFASVAFHGAPTGRCYGKITPHYMGGPVAWRDETATAEAESAAVVTARRIADAFPDIKLIAMLRIVKGTPGLRHAWHALPDRARTGARARFRTLAERLDQRNPVGDEGMRQAPDPALIERLRQHFAADAELLEKLV